MSRTADYSSANQQDCERYPSAAGLKVLNRARKYLAIGVAETGTNSGPYINGWLSAWGLGANFWCGAFADAMYRESHVSDDHMGHPAVATIYTKAQEKKLLSTVPYPGCFVLHVHLLSNGNLDTSYPYGGGVHVDLFERWHNKQAGLAVVIGGNVDDAVTRKIRDVAGPTSGGDVVRYAVPRALRTSLDNTIYTV